MTGYVLFASGKNFDVDSFLESSPWREHVSIVRKGDKSESRNKSALKYSSLQLQITDDAINIELQTKEAISFLTSNDSQLLRLKNFPGIEEIELRVGGYWHQDTAAFIHSFPAQLVALAAKYNMEISACVYATADD